MSVPIHYVPSFLLRMMIKSGLVDIKDYRPTVDGWNSVIICKTTNQAYKMTLTPIKSEVTVGLMADDVISKGGFNYDVPGK